MDTLVNCLEFVVVLACIFIGSRYGGVGLGLWGSFGVFVLTYVFGHSPTSPPIDVMLIILAVIMAASVMEAAGGIDYLVQPGGKKKPFCTRSYWAILTPYTQTTLPKK